MSSENLIPCLACGAPNSALAFRCHQCNVIFDGAAVHTIVTSRILTKLSSQCGVQPVPICDEAGHKWRARFSVASTRSDLYEKEAPHTNLCPNLGSGSSLRQWYKSVM